MASSPSDRESLTARAALRAEATTVLTDLRRRNPSAVAMDVLFLFAVAFFAHHLLRGFWPAVIAGVPLLALLYFGLRSSKAFFLAQVLTIAGALLASRAGWIPL